MLMFVKTAAAGQVKSASQFHPGSLRFKVSSSDTGRRKSDHAIFFPNCLELLQTKRRLVSKYLGESDAVIVIPSLTFPRRAIITCTYLGAS